MHRKRNLTFTFAALIILAASTFFSNPVLGYDNGIAPTRRSFLEQVVSDVVEQRVAGIETRADAAVSRAFSLLEMCFIVLGLLLGGSLFNINKGAKAVFESFISKNEKRIFNNIEKWSKAKIDGVLGFDKKVLLLTNDGTSIENEIKALKARGFTQLYVKGADEFEEGYDVVVFFYNDTLNPQLDSTAKQLIESNANTTLIVYYQKGIVQNTEVKKYLWHTYANTPLTLTSAIFSAPRMEAS